MCGFGIDLMVVLLCVPSSPVPQALVSECRALSSESPVPSDLNLMGQIYVSRFADG